MSRKVELDDSGRIVLHINWQAAVKLIIILGLAFGSYFLSIPGLTTSSKICLMIFISAAGLWVTEVIPPFATGIMVIVMSIYLLGLPQGPLNLNQNGLENSYRIFLNPIASPILVLFFGGFILAIAATKHGFDKRIAKAFLKPFGTKPKMVLLGVILITALFSMFMSNTATTAMMIAVLTPLFSHFKDRDPFRKALVLSIPFAANIGGIGTIIGTPPNAVAASVLGEIGSPITFFQWMIVGVPLAAILLFALWVLLCKVFKPREDKFEILFPEKLELTWDLITVMAIFGITVILWLTQPLHGIPPGVVALIPILVFSAFGIITREDLRKIEWHVLILIAGGMTLGVAMKYSGLSDVMIHSVTGIGLSPLLLLIAITSTAIIISNFMSHTSAANLIIPIVASLSIFSPLIGTVAVAFACSFAMSLPISTPPNAIAFATQEITTKDMVKYGTLVSLIAFSLLVGLIIIVSKYN